MSDASEHGLDLEADGDREYRLISESFTTQGYREGIINGKEDALQHGFDQGFATIGVPLGRRLGALRGFAAALGTFAIDPEKSDKAKQLAHNLSRLDWAKVAPVDAEALEHAKEHLEDESIPELQSAVDHEQNQILLESYITELASLCRELNVPLPKHLLP